jgi:hypothetical protein
MSGGGDYMPLLAPRLGPLLLPATAELVRRLEGAVHPAQERRARRARLRAWVRRRIAGPEAAPPRPPAVGSPHPPGWR